MGKSVVLELEWMLRGYYKSPGTDLLTVLRQLFSLPNVVLEDRMPVDLAVNALDDGLDFADALHQASSLQCASLATLDDREFARRAALRGWSPPVWLLT